MKKHFLKIGFVAVFAAVAGYGVYTSQKSETLSDLALANVEALAQSEQSGCPNGCVSDGNGCTCNGTHYPYWHEYGTKR